MPFALTTRPLHRTTKTPGIPGRRAPVVSTGIRDVRRHYEALDGVRIADGVDDFVAACDAQLRLAANGSEWLAQSDALLAGQSWDRTFADMETLVRRAAPHRRAPLARPVRTAPTKRFDESSSAGLPEPFSTTTPRADPRRVL